MHSDAINIHTTQWIQPYLRYYVVHCQAWRSMWARERWGVGVRIMNILMTFYLRLENVYIPTFPPLLTLFAAAYDKWPEFGFLVEHFIHRTNRFCLTFRRTLRIHEDSWRYVTYVYRLPISCKFISEISERIVIREIDSGGSAPYHLFQRVVKRDESHSCVVDEGPRSENGFGCLFSTAINRFNYSHPFRFASSLGKQ